ncbi:MAG: F0F1 ATP synthase subunit B [Pseudomonadota bacterium]|nr:F0F1 ATP synthase subunit B [Pseudomonadota bacterium]
MSITITLFGQILTFLVLVLFVWRFLWGPVTQTMAERQKRIANGLAAAERGKHELELAEHHATDRLRSAKQDAADIIAAANKRADEIIEEAKEKARQEGQRQLDAAQAEIELETNRAREHLREQVLSLAVAIAEKVLSREIDATAHNEFVEKMIKEL